MKRRSNAINMINFLIFTALWTTSTAQDLCIRGHIHERSELVGIDLKPWSRVAIDSENGILYYAGLPDASANKSNSLRYYTLPGQQDRGELLTVKDIWQLSVDRYTSHLYLVANNDSSTDLNLYRYDRRAKSVTMLAQRIGDTDQFVYQFFAFKNQVYWIGGDLQMYRYSKGRIGKHNIRLVAYHEDLDGNIYMIKEKEEHHVYKVRKGEKNQLRFVSADYLDAFKTDAKGKVYVGSILSYKLYDISEEEGRLVQVSDALPGSPSYIHFDQANDIIWVDRERFFGKLTSTLKACNYKK